MQHVPAVLVAAVPSLLACLYRTTAAAVGRFGCSWQACSCSCSHHLLIPLQQQLLPHKLSSLLLHKEQLARVRLQLLLLMLLLLHLQAAQWRQRLH
jgi:hypothetical protein